MPFRRRNKNTSAQTAMEYMLLLGIVVVVVLAGFRKYIPKSKASSELYFNNISVGILGTPANCYDLSAPINCP